jgi:hypothetical protein
VATDVVWQKILTAPDDSTLEISLNGKKIGYCRWSANTGEEVATGKAGQEDAPPEGMVPKLSRYTIDLEGNIFQDRNAGRVRFNLHLEFATNHLWREISARIATRPSIWTVHTTAARQTLDLKYEDPAASWTRTFSFDDLRDPRVWLEEFGGSLPLALLGPAIGQETARPQKMALGLEWQARNDWLRIGHSQVRVYRLQAHLFDRYQAVVILSRVGEILRVELPNGLLLVNEALTNL